MLRLASTSVLVYLCFFCEDTCPKPPENLLCLMGLRNTCFDEASCVKGTLCCHDGCRRRCKDPSQFSRGELEGKIKAPLAPIFGTSMSLVIVL